VGGAGKTPISIYLAKLLQGRGKKICFLSRGYGGSYRGVVQVTAAHNSNMVGDEAINLSAIAPTIVARNRVDGAAMAASSLSPDYIIMDDGLQNNSLFKDISLLIIDGFSGLGNGHLLPAGPLREPLQAALSKVKAIVIIGGDRTNIRNILPSTMAIFQAYLMPENYQHLVSQKVIAFAAIGQPQKFFHSLKEINCLIVAQHEFPDHYQYLQNDLERLIAQAEAEQALLVTTTKDLVKIPKIFHQKIHVLSVSIVVQDEAGLIELLQI
jgi:tetraacyldisaccharide 4'-kinase